MGMKRQNGSSKVVRKRLGPNQPKGKRLITSLIHQPAYAGEWIKDFTLPGATQLVTTSGTSFSVNQALGTLSSNTLNFTDFSTLFDEYVIIGATVSITCMTPPTPGCAFWWFDNSASTAPSVTDEGRNGAVRTVHSMNDHKVWTMTYRVIDYSLLSFRRTVIDYDVGYFKGITNAANFGTSAANTLLYSYRVLYHVCFRGRKV